MSTPKRAPSWSYVSMIVGILLLLAAAAVWLLLPIRYEAYALLQVSRRPPAVLDRTPLSVEEFAIFKRTQVQLILSGLVLQNTVREPSINRSQTILEHTDDPTSWLKGQLIIDYPDDSEIMRVAMRGTDPNEIKKIVDMVVDRYMLEIVQHEKEKRRDQETRLQATFDKLQRELASERDTLHKLEFAQKAPSSDAAQLAKKLAMQQLEISLAQRAKLDERIAETTMQIRLIEAREALPKDVRTAEPDAKKEPAADDAKLLLLEKENEFLEARRNELDERIQEQTKIVESLDSFSATVAAKQESMQALQRITSELRDKLDRVRIESEAVDRIVALDKATLATGQGDAMRKYVVVAIASALGLALFVIGVVGQWPRQLPS